MTDLLDQLNPTKQQHKYLIKHIVKKQTWISLGLMDESYLANVSSNICRLTCRLYLLDKPLFFTLAVHKNKQRRQQSCN